MTTSDEQASPRYANQAEIFTARQKKKPAPSDETLIWLRAMVFHKTRS